MDRRFRWLALVTILGILLSPSPAFSGPKDAAAIKLAEDAINNDYLATNFTTAEKKIRNAITMCGTSACSVQTRARLHRDLAVVLVAGLNRPDDGRKEFAEALKIDPSIALEKDLTTPEVEQAFQAAKGGGSAGGPSARAPAGGAGAAAAAGDMTHTPPAEQTILTPVPIYVELPDGVNAAKVVVRYKPFGTPDWKTLELRKLGGGYGGEIPCAEVGSATGDLSYYVQATDANGDVVSMSGSRNAPNKVPIKAEIAGDPPHLPGKSPSAQCRDKADCPPGFPGCAPGKKRTGGNKSWGDACQKETECGEGLTCKSGQCETGDKTEVAEPEEGIPCDNNQDCGEGETCGADKICQLGAGVLKKIWLSANIQQDFSFIASQDNVCGSANAFAPNNVVCIDEQNFTYDGVPEDGAAGAKMGNAVKGGPHTATTRFALGLDYLAGSNITLGLRLGVAIGTAPGRSISALHAEGRAALWIGKNPFRKQRLRPFVALVAGLVEIDDKFTVPIRECTSAACNSLKPQDETFPPTQNLTVWHKSGGSFAGLAGGVMIPVASNMGVVAELKLQALFPNTGFAISPSVGYALGL